FDALSKPMRIAGAFDAAPRLSAANAMNNDARMRFNVRMNPPWLLVARLGDETILRHVRRSNVDRASSPTGQASRAQVIVKQCASFQTIRLRRLPPAPNSPVPES